MTQDAEPPDDSTATEVHWVLPSPIEVSAPTPGVEATPDLGVDAPPVVEGPDARSIVEVDRPAGPDRRDEWAALGAISASTEEIRRSIDALRSSFDREVRAEATRERVVDRLHAELQEYKQGLILGILRPVFVELIQLHDDLGKTLAAPRASEDPPPPEVGRLVQLIEGYQQSIQDLLYRQGVETFSTDEPGFDPKRQRALSTVPTDDPSLNKQVAARVRKGFQAGDRIIRPEVVTVYAHRPGPRPPAES